MPINAKLVVVGGEVKAAEIKLRLPCTIGRGRGCTIMLPQALVSRQHCELFESGGKVMVRDLGSLNGTFVNNQKISEPCPVNSEELLTIGTVTFRVVYETAAESSPPAGPAPVMKTPAKDTFPTAASPAASHPDDSSQPLEIGDFNFEETVRPSAEAVPPAGQAPAAKAPATPSAVPVTQTTGPAKPAAPTTKGTPAPAPTPAKKGGETSSAPLPAKPAAPSPSSPVGEEPAQEEEEDDFQDFLKSLGSK